MPHPAIVNRRCKLWHRVTPIDMRRYVGSLAKLDQRNTAVQTWRRLGASMHLLRVSCRHSGLSYQPILIATSRRAHEVHPGQPPPKMAVGSFTSDNGPHGEHDFGAFDFRGAGKVFWIDYYDLTLTGRSENPADQAQTTRVLTLMLAREY